MVNFVKKAKKWKIKRKIRNIRKNVFVMVNKILHPSENILLETWPGQAPWFNLSKKLGLLSYMEGEYRGQLAQLQYQRQFMHLLFDRLFEIIFDTQKKSYKEISKISYAVINQDFVKIYSKELENLQKDLINHVDNETLQITKLITAQKVEIDLLLQRNEKRFSKLTSMHRDLEDLMNSTEGIICTTKNRLSEIYANRIKDFDKEIQQKIQLLNEDFSFKSTKIAEEYKRNLMSAVENKPEKRDISIKSIKTRVSILQENVSTIKKQYNDLLKAYKSFSKFPSMVLKDLFDSLNIQTDPKVKSLIQTNFQQEIEIQSLHLQNLRQKQKFSLEKYDLYTELLQIRDQKLDYLASIRLPPQENVPIRIDSTILDRERETLDHEYNEFKDRMENRIIDTQERFTEEITQKNFDLEQILEEYLDKVEIPTDNIEQNYISEYNALQSIYHSLDFTSADNQQNDYELEYLKTKLALYTTMASRLKIEEATNKIKQKLNNDNDIKKQLLQNQILQQDDMNKFHLTNQQNFIDNKNNIFAKQEKNLREHLAQIKEIHDTAAEQMKASFENQIDQMIDYYAEQRYILFIEDPEIHKRVKYLKFMFAKANLTPGEYITFLENYIYQTAIK